MQGSEVTQIREDLNISQAEFSRKFGINLHTLRQWERKDTALDSAAAAYLTCIKRDAEGVIALLPAPEVAD